MTIGIETESVEPLRFGAADSVRTSIAAGSARVYAVMLDRALWLDGFLGRNHVDGPTHAVGERAIYRSVSGERLEELLLAEPPRRHVTRLADAADTTTHAFAEWRIEDEGSGCSLEFTLYWIDTAPSGSSWAETQTLRAGYSTATRAQLEKHLQQIKQVAENMEQLP